MMKKFLFLLMSFLLTVSCSKTDDVNTETSNNNKENDNRYDYEPVDEKKYDVYIVGYEEIGGVNIAKYWKNGVAHILPEGDIAQSIEVVNNDVYIAGYYKKGTKNVAKYWKNDLSVNLTDGSIGARAHDIIVYNNDIYVTGMVGDYNMNSLQRKAVYWKNGKKTEITPLVSGKQYVEEIARDICFDKGEMYILLENINSRDNTLYWRDGKRFECKGKGDGICMDVKDGSVHIAGISIVYGPQRAVTYWKDSYLTGITDHTVNGYDVTDIEVSGNDVYIAGRDAGDAVYWKNGNSIILKGGSIAGAIKFIDGKVFAAGGDRKKLNYWENGQLTTYTTTGEVFVTSMAVVKK